jgi:hypothetical protein
MELRADARKPGATGRGPAGERKAAGHPSPSPGAAPDTLLYGHVADTAIYPSVDERIAAVSDGS